MPEMWHGRAVPYGMVVWPVVALNGRVDNHLNSLSILVVGVEFCFRDVIYDPLRYILYCLFLI